MEEYAMSNDELVTVEELKKQIWEIEGVKVDIFPSKGNELGYSRLVKPYNYERLPDDATVDDLNKRISELQVGEPYELRLAKIWTHTRREKIEEYERVIHRYLIKEGYQIRKDSEWFRLCKPILKLLLAPNTIQEQNKVIEFIHKDLQ